MAAKNQAIMPEPETDDRLETLTVVELLFFAYRDFIADPDQILDGIGFGRAHHRVIHFVGSRPGMSVADLLEILSITKQSLARVLKQLIDGGFVRQTAGPEDRRQRRLFLTSEGERLRDDLLSPQIKRIDKAFAAMPDDQRKAVGQFLTRMCDHDPYAFDHQPIAPQAENRRGA